MTGVSSRALLSEDRDGESKMGGGGGGVCCPTPKVVYYCNHRLTLQPVHPPSRAHLTEQPLLCRNLQDLKGTGYHHTKYNTAIDKQLT